MNRGVGTRELLTGAALWLVFLLVGAWPAFAQIDRGAIVGTVRDTSGALVSKATVTVTSKDTGVALTTPVNDVGEYQLLALLPGTYVVKASAQGFETAVRDGIVVHLQDRLSLNFTLRVGSVAEQVVVTESEPLLQTQSANLGNVIDTQRVNDLPLIWRCWSPVCKSFMLPITPPRTGLA